MRFLLIGGLDSWTIGQSNLSTLKVVFELMSRELGIFLSYEETCNKINCKMKKKKTAISSSPGSVETINRRTYVLK